MTRWLLTGASGQLGAYLLRELAQNKQPVTAWSGKRRAALFGFDLEPVDLADPGQVTAAFERARPTAVIHAAALATIAECRRDPGRAWRINNDATGTLAHLCRRAGARLMYISTDLVFDGEQGGYREDDLPSPLSVYGRTKAAAERLVLAVPGAVVVRASLMLGPTLIGKPFFFDEQLAGLREGRPLHLFTDEWRSPFGLAPAARVFLAVLDSDFSGTLHVAGPERMSRFEMGRRLAAYLQADPATIVPTERRHFPSPEPRPRDTSLDCSLWRTRFPNQPWPIWEEALQEMGVTLSS
jgi:dTDP-4-dehydrorhamnose reductase